jgi:hypothetical protein
MRGLAVAAACIAAAGMCAAPAAAQPGQTEPCPRYDGKYEIPAGWEGSPAPGVGVVVADEEQVTFTIADGFVLTRLCYKTGVRGGGATSAQAPIVGPATVTVTKTNPGGGLSHVTFDVEPWVPPVQPPIPPAQPPVPPAQPPVPPVQPPVPPVQPPVPPVQPLVPPAEPKATPKRPVKKTKRKVRKARKVRKKPSRKRAKVRWRKPRVLPFTP